MQRKLASVQRVLEIHPIANADAIELVRINGWQCVTRKGEFSVGDLGLYFEIDSIPPDAELFRFLWQPKQKLEETLSPEPVARPEKYRIRTMRLRGALSQGLFMPVSQFDLDDITEGEDVTERLGVGKYEPPAPTGMGDFRASFPAFLLKTDEMRVQSVPAVLDELRGQAYVATMKYDGTSATYCIDPRDGQFHACGRNFSVRPGENIYWQMASKYDLEAKLRSASHLAIQGEIVGPGIQKNPLALKEKSLFAFNVFNIREAHYLGHDESRRVLDGFELPAVQVIEEGESFDHSLESLLSLAEGKYPSTKNEREGIVIRPRGERPSLTLCGRLSFKAISNRYLLKEAD